MGLAPPSHAGINHLHMHRAFWKVPATGHQRERAAATGRKIGGLICRHRCCAG